MKRELLLLCVLGSLSKPNSCSADDKTITFDLGNKVTLDLIKINAKGKKFLMGSPADETHRGDDEDQRVISLNHDFYMGKFEVTQEQFEAVMDVNPSTFKGPKNPVETMSREDALEFIKKLNEMFVDRQVTFRLPSEAEWEYACRAGTTTPFHFGAVLSGKLANFDGKYPFGATAKGPFLKKTAPVGSYEANAFGLYDMHGNVWEWCEDFYGEYKAAPNDGTAQTKKQPGDGYHVVRGGSWISDAQTCRSANRYYGTAVIRYNGTGGFRVAATTR